TSTKPQFIGRAKRKWPNLHGRQGCPFGCRVPGGITGSASVAFTSCATRLCPLGTVSVRGRTVVLADPKLVEPQLVEPIVESMPRDLENSRSLELVAARRVERADDQLAFCLFHARDRPGRGLVGRANARAHAHAHPPRTLNHV